MEYEIIATNTFKKDVKQYKKKYKNIIDDLDKVIERLKVGDFVGDVIPNIAMLDNDNNIIKVRVANSDIPTGKSGRL